MRSWRLSSLLAPLLLPGMAWPTEVVADSRSRDPGAVEAAPAIPVPAAIDPVVVEAQRFYDGLGDETKRKVLLKIATSYDPSRSGALARRIDPPWRFGALRLYPKAYDLARRVSALPLDQQQRIYAYAHAHQLRSGWLTPGH